jgi:ribosome-binding protein aMBF1 (putative translation factor)
MSNNGWVTVSHNKPKSNKPKVKSVQEPVETPKYEPDTIVLRKHQKKKITGPPVVNTTRTNTNTTSELNMRKLDENEVGGVHKKVDKSISQLLQQTLVSRGWNYDRLVKEVSGRAGVNKQDVQNIIKGAAIQNNSKLEAIEKTLNIHLRGKKVGEPYIQKKN